MSHVKGSCGLLSDIFTGEFIPTDDELTKLDELQEKLETEIFQNKNLSRNVKNAIAEITEDQANLLKFIRGRKQNVKKAAASIKRYAEIRFEIYPDLYPDPVPEYVRYVYEQRIVSALRHRDHLGRALVTFSICHWDPSVVSLDQVGIAARFMVDAALNMPQVFVGGIVAVQDHTGVSLRHAPQFTPRLVLKYIDLLTKAYPLPLKGVFVAHTPAFIRALYSLMRPFLPKHLVERVHLMPKGLEQLVSPNILPQSLGGVLPDDVGYLSPEELKMVFKFLQ